MRRRITLFVLLAAACGPHSPPATDAPKESQSYREAIQLMCDADKRAGITDDDDPISRGEKRDDWLADHIHNSDAIYFRTLWRVKPRDEQSATLRAEAKDAGLGSCALADSVATGSE